MSNAATDGFGNTPWGGTIVAGVTPSDGYGPMGWGNQGEAGSVRSDSRHEHRGLVNNPGAHLVRNKNSGVSR